VYFPVCRDKGNVVYLRRMKMKKLANYVVGGIACALFLAPLGVAPASELIWTPINPSFGGPSYNAQWLMASAEAQNRHIEKAAPYTYVNPMDDFQNNLNRQLFSRLTTKILDEAFGEETTVPLQTGQYLIGDYTIDVSTNGNITVLITDNITGNTTTVSVPYY